MPGVAPSKLSAGGLAEQIKGGGTLIALTFLLTLEDSHRFGKSRAGGPPFHFTDTI